MNDKELLDIYTDYLISSFGLTTQTGLSRLLNGAISHDRVQRFLSREPKLEDQVNAALASHNLYPFEPDVDGLSGQQDNSSGLGQVRVATA